MLQFSERLTLGGSIINSALVVVAIRAVASQVRLELAATFLRKLLLLWLVHHSLLLALGGDLALSLQLAKSVGQLALNKLTDVESLVLGALEVDQGFVQQRLSICLAQVRLLHHQSVVLHKHVKECLGGLALDQSSSRVQVLTLLILCQSFGTNVLLRARLQSKK